MKKLTLTKKVLTPVVAVVAMLSLLALGASGVLAWQEGPGTDWWFIDASYGGWKTSVPLVIEINDNPADGQVFGVGDTVTITCYIHAYAVTCAGAHGDPANEASTALALSVNGPSGSDSDIGGDYHFNEPSCAEVNTIDTLTVVYPLTAGGTHTAYATSNAQVRQYDTDVADDFVDASLTFVVEPITVEIDIKPGEAINPINPTSKGVIPVAILTTLPLMPPL